MLKRFRHISFREVSRRGRIMGAANHFHQSVALTDLHGPERMAEIREGMIEGGIEPDCHNQNIAFFLADTMHNKTKDLRGIAAAYARRMKEIQEENAGLRPVKPFPGSPAAYDLADDGGRW